MWEVKNAAGTHPFLGGFLPLHLLTDPVQAPTPEVLPCDGISLSFSNSLLRRTLAPPHKSHPSAPQSGSAPATVLIRCAIRISTQFFILTRISRYALRCTHRVSTFHIQRRRGLIHENHGAFLLKGPWHWDSRCRSRRIRQNHFPNPGPYIRFKDGMNKFLTFSLPWPLPSPPGQMRLYVPDARMFSMMVRSNRTTSWNTMEKLLSRVSILSR